MLERLGVSQSNSQKSLQHDKHHGVQPELKNPCPLQALGYFHSLARAGSARGKSLGCEPELGLRGSRPKVAGSFKRELGFAEILEEKWRTMQCSRFGVGRTGAP